MQLFSKVFGHCNTCTILNDSPTTVLLHFCGSDIVKSILNVIILLLTATKSSLNVWYFTL